MSEATKKAWYFSKTIWLAIAMGILNAYFMGSTFIDPVYASAGDQLPVMPFSLDALLVLNVILGGAIVYTRKIANRHIA